MDIKAKPIVKKPKMIPKICEACAYKKGDFFEREDNPDITRVYCKARHVDVICEMMGKYCDFFEKKSDEY